MSDVHSAVGFRLVGPERRRRRGATLFTDDEMDQLRELYLVRQRAFREAREAGQRSNLGGFDPRLDP